MTKTIIEKFTEQSKRDMSTVLKGMKENDIQTLLDFLINEVEAINVRVSTIEKKG